MAVRLYISSRTAANSIAVPIAKSVDEPFEHELHLERSSPTHRQRTSLLPKGSRLTALTSNQGTTRPRRRLSTKESPPGVVYLPYRTAVVPFVVTAPGTTRSAGTSIDCLADVSLPPSDRFRDRSTGTSTGDTLPRVQRLNHVADKATHRIPTRLLQRFLR